nr:uncharacterized protein LOC126531621 [Dermacentor andersoni]
MASMSVQLGADGPDVLAAKQPPSTATRGQVAPSGGGVIIVEQGRSKDSTFYANCPLCLFGKVVMKSWKSFQKRSANRARTAAAAMATWTEEATHLWAQEAWTSNKVYFFLSLSCGESCSIN